MSIRRISGTALLLAAVAFALPACERTPEGDDQQTGSMTSDEVKAARADWSETASAQIDSGNAAYQARDLQKALGHYEAALAAAEDSKSAKVTSYFGIYMVQMALGDSAAAAAAMAKAQEISPEASLIHGDMTQGAPPRTPQDSVHGGMVRPNDSVHGGGQ